MREALSPDSSMRALIQSRICFVVLIALGVFSLFAGEILEVCARSSAASIHFYLSGMLLPRITEWFLDLHSEIANPLLTLSFLPTLITMAYFWHLVRSETDPVKLLAKFALMALASFILITTFFVTALWAFGLPFLPMSGRMRSLSDFPPPTTLQTGIFICFVALLLINGFALIRMFLSFRAVKNENHK